MISITDLSKSYNNSTNAVDNLNLVIPSGQITGFLGPNGAGKTTTIKMITGILKADSGNININDFSIEANPVAAKRIIGYVPDNPDIFLRLKGIEYLNFIASMYDMPLNVKAEKINEYAGLFEIKSALNDKIQSYSHGMRQKIVLTGALIHEPEILILDEPLTGLDPKASFQLKELLKKKSKEGKTIFFSTHVLDVAEKLCDSVALINKGKLLFNGPITGMKDQFQKNGSLESIFLELTENE